MGTPPSPFPFELAFTTLTSTAPFFAQQAMMADASIFLHAATHPVGDGCVCLLTLQQGVPAQVAAALLGQGDGHKLGAALLLKHPVALCGPLAWDVRMSKMSRGGVRPTLPAPGSFGMSGTYSGHTPPPSLPMRVPLTPVQTLTRPALMPGPTSLVSPLSDRLRGAPVIPTIRVDRPHVLKPSMQQLLPPQLQGQPLGLNLKLQLPAPHLWCTCCVQDHS